MFRHLSPLILAGLSVRIPKERGSIHVFSALQSGRTFPFLSLLVLFLTLLITVFLIPHRQQTNAQATTFPSLPDTTSNIHLGQVFNYNLTNPTTEAGSIDYVWGSNYP